MPDAPVTSVPLGSLLDDLRSGISFRGKPPEDPDGSVYVVRLSSVNYADATIRWEDCPVIARSERINRHELVPGNLLISGRGHQRVAFYVDEMPGPAVADSPFFVLDVDKTRVHPRFLALQINQPRPQNWLARRSRGTRMPTLRKKDLEQLPVRLPDMDIQQQLADLQRLIRRQRTLMDRLDSRYQELVRGISQDVT